MSEVVLRDVSRGNGNHVEPVANKNELDGIKRLVELQVKVPNLSKVLPALNGFGKIEPVSHVVDRLGGNQTKGALVLEQTLLSGLRGVMQGLENSKYTLVDAVVERRDHADGNGSYLVQRFIFCHPDFVDPEEEMYVPLVASRDEIMMQIKTMINNTRGRSRAFNNPYFDPENKNQIMGQRAILLNYY